MKNLPATQLMQAIRAAYPVQCTDSEVVDGSAPAGARCVGAAYCAFIGEPAGALISTTRLANTLAYHTSMSDRRARTMAARIIDANDAGHFDAAWRALERALEAR